MACRSVSAQSSARTTSPHGQGTVALLAASRGLRSRLSQVADSEWRYFEDLLRVELSDLVSGRPMRKGRWQGTKPAIGSWERCPAGPLRQNHSGLLCSIPMCRNLATLPLVGAGTGRS